MNKKMINNLPQQMLAEKHTQKERKEIRNP